VRLPRLALIAVLAGLPGCGPKGELDPLYVGQLLPLSGTERARGVASRQGVRLAVEEAVAAGSLCQGRALAVRHVDDRGDPEVVRAEATRLLSVNKVPALLGCLSPALSERLAQTVAPSGVPLLVPGELPDVPQGDGVFFLALPADRGRALARFAVEELKATRTAVLTDGRDPVASAVAAGFLAEWRRLKGTAAPEFPFRPEIASSQLLGPLKEAAESGAVLVAVGPRDFARLRDEMKGLKGHLLHGGADVEPQALAPSSAVEVYQATVFCEEKLTERGKAFAKKYREEFQTAPDLIAAQSYDSVRLLFEALSQAGPAAPKVREYLSRIEDWETVTGPLTLKDRRPQRPVFVVRLQEGKVEWRKTYAP
jgi:branched-chain amino acid transport system substrate-binding protein